jgi:hypothetical protein
MKRLSLLLVLLSVSAWAQNSRTGARLPRTVHAQPLPTGSGQPFRPARQPLLNSWVVGWSLTGSKPEAYEITCDSVFTDCGVPILRTRPGASEPLGTGSLTHSEGAMPWRGMRVQLRAELRAGRIGGWAGLWVRIDGPGGKVLRFDNMQNRPLRGTTSFDTYSVVMDVPPEAERVSFGVLLHGPGAVYIRELQFEEAPEGLASTDLLAPLKVQARATTP